MKDSRTNKTVKLVSEALNRPFFQQDPAFARLSEAKIREPVALHDEEGGPHSWIVPLTFKDTVCGTVQLSMDLEIMRVNSHCRGEDMAGGFNIGFFEEPPKGFLDEVSGKYSVLTQPMLSFDRNHTRWGWRLEALVEGERLPVFITPAGWYVRLKTDIDVEGACA